MEQSLPMERPSRLKLLLKDLRSAPGTIALIMVCVVMFALSYPFSSFWLHPSEDRLQILGLQVNQLVRQGDWWRLLTTNFLHGASWHLFFNVLSLWMLRIVERVYLTWRFLMVFVLSAVGSSLASYMFVPRDTLGASGAILGLLAAFFIFAWVNREFLFRKGEGDRWKNNMRSIIVIVILNVILGLAFIRTLNIVAHIGGLLIGGVAGLILTPRATSEADKLTDSPWWSWPVALVLLAAMFALSLLLPGADLSPSALWG
jgi:rhomboid protease GluP